MRTADSRRRRAPAAFRGAPAAFRRALAAFFAAAVFATVASAVWSPTPAGADPDPDALSPAKTLDRRANEPAAESDTAVASIAEARRHADAKRFGDAARTLRAVLAINPANLDARSLLARVLAWDGKYDESIIEYRRILRDHPDNAFDRAGYARVLSWAGRTGESLRQFRRVSRSNSADDEALISFARAAAWAGDLPGASELYRKILRDKPRNGDAWLGLATVARWRGSPTAADRFLARAAAHGADSAGVEEERLAIRQALAPSIGAGMTTAHERQYVDGSPDFVIESTGPYARAAATIARTAGIAVRASRIAQFERSIGPPVAGTTLNYDLDMTVLRADVSLLRGYPVQVAAGVEQRSLKAGSPNVLYPLADDSFFGWNARVWWFGGRWTPSFAVRREHLVLKSTTGPQRLLAGNQSVVAADIGWQWNARGTALVGLEQGTYSDGNERGTVRAGAAYRVRLNHPGVTVDYGLNLTDFESRSASYFTPLESVRHAGGIALAGYSESAGMDYGVRYQIAALRSSNFSDIVTNTGSGYLNLTAFGAFPIGVEGSYSRDNNAYETWYLGVSAGARW